MEEIHAQEAKSWLTNQEFPNYWNYEFQCRVHMGPFLKFS